MEDYKLLPGKKYRITFYFAEKWTEKIPIFGGSIEEQDLINAVFYAAAENNLNVQSYKIIDERRICATFEVPEREKGLTLAIAISTAIAISAVTASLGYFLGYSTENIKIENVERLVMEQPAQQITRLLIPLVLGGGLILGGLTWKKISD